MPALGGHPPVPAVGAHPPVPAAGGPNIPAWDPAWAQVEIERFRTLRDWGCFTQLLAKKLCTSPRRALSAHTTTACQPKKADGPAGSLKDAGINNMLPADGGQVFVRVELPHAFSHGDGLAVTYVSTAEKDAKAVQNQACLELLCYLVVSAPGRVRLPPGGFMRGEADVDDFRAKAIKFSQQVGFTDKRLAWQIPEIHAGQPLAALAAFGQHAGPGQPLAAMQPIAPPPAAAGPIEPAVGGDEAVLKILRSLRINTEYQTGKHSIPTDIGKQLEPVLRKHGLLPFLQRYPQYFDVTLTGGVTSKNKPQYTFKMKAAINDVAAIQPAVGGGAAVAAPAVGGLAPAIGGHESPMEPAVPPPAPTPALAPVGGDTVPGASSSLPAVGNNTVPGASSSLPVVGSNQTPHGIMSDWDVLGYLVRRVSQCSEDDLAETIELTALQLKKIVDNTPG